MCKLFAIVEIENQKDAEEFTRLAIPKITETDNHGLGIMRLGEKGIHIQRWLEPPALVRNQKSKALLKYADAVKHQYNELGSRSKKLYSIAVHGRFATCARSLQNTHPFFREGVALMHNGVISNSTKDNVVSTCDSEVLLTHYLDKGMKFDHTKLTETLTDVKGYYAAIVFNNNGTIDIWRDNTATLFIAHVRGVGVVIATTAEIITKTARKFRAYVTGLDEILPFTAIRWKQGRDPIIHEFDVVKTAVEDEEEYWWKDYNEFNAAPPHSVEGYKYSERGLTEEEEEEERQLRRLQGRDKYLGGV